MIPEAIRAAIEECEAHGSRFVTARLGHIFAESIASRYEDIAMSRVTVLLLANAADLPALLPDGFSSGGSAPRLILWSKAAGDLGTRFDALEPPRESTLFGRNRPTGDRSNAVAIRKERIESALFGLESLSLLIAACPPRYLADAYWYDLIADHADVVLLCGPLDQSKGDLQSLPMAGEATASIALERTSAGPVPPLADIAGQPRSVCGFLAAGQDLQPLLRKIAVEVAPAIALHKCQKLLESARRELAFERTRTDAIVQLRERLGRSRTLQAAPRDDAASSKARRALRDEADARLQQVDDALNASEVFAMGAEHLVAASDLSLEWREDVLTGHRPVTGREPWWTNVVNRTFLLHVSDGTLTRVEEKLARVLRVRVEKDAANIDRDLLPIEQEVSQQAQKLFGAAFEPLVLPRLSKADCASLERDMTLRADAPEKLVRPGYFSLFMHAQGLIMRLVQVGLLVAVAYYGSVAYVQGQHQIQSPTVSAIKWVIPIIAMIYLIFLARTAPLEERKRIDEVTQRMKTKLAQQTEAKLREAETARGQLIRQHFQKVKAALGRYCNDLEDRVRSRQAVEAVQLGAKEQTNEQALTLWTQRRTRVEALLEQVSKALTALGQAADKPYRLARAAVDSLVAGPTSPAQQPAPSAGSVPIPHTIATLGAAAPSGASATAEPAAVAPTASRARVGFPRGNQGSGGHY